jgi:hypothetical protein
MVTENGSLKMQRAEIKKQQSKKLRKIKETSDTGSHTSCYNRIKVRVQKIDTAHGNRLKIIF